MEHTRLPPEVLFHLFGYLGAKDLCQCSMVSHTWQQTASDGTLWKRLYFRVYIHPNPPEDEGDVLGILAQEETEQVDERKVERRLRYEYGMAKMDWRKAFERTHAIEEDKKIYSQRTLHPPSHFYYDALRDPINNNNNNSNRLSQCMDIIFPSSVNPLRYSPSLYRRYRPFHPSTSHLNYWIPSNYLRLLDCLLFHPDWFWYYYTSSSRYKGDETKRLLLMGVILLMSMAGIPLLYGMVFLSSSGWMVKSLLLWAMEAPIGLAVVLLYTSQEPFEESHCTRLEHRLIKGIFYVGTILFNACYFGLVLGLPWVVVGLPFIIAGLTVLLAAGPGVPLGIIAGTIIALLIGCIIYYPFLWLILATACCCIPFFLAAVAADEHLYWMNMIPKGTEWDQAKIHLQRMHSRISIINLYLLLSFTLLHFTLFHRLLSRA